MTPKGHGRAGSTETPQPAEPIHPLLMMFDDAVAAVAMAELALAGRRPEAAWHNGLTSAKEIITEMTMLLDHEFGGAFPPPELAAGYRSCLEALADAEERGTGVRLRFVRHSLCELRKACARAADQTATTQASSRWGDIPTLRREINVS